MNIRFTRRTRLGALAALASLTFVFPVTPALADLSPDSSFGGQGTVIVGSDGLDQFHDVVAVDDGYLAVGAWNNGTRVIVTKYDLAGIKDSTFGDRGRTLIDLGVTASGFEIIERPTGDFLVTAFTDEGFALMVVRGDGSLNRDFGRRGIVKQRTAGFFTLNATIDDQRRIVMAIGEQTSADWFKSRIHVWRFTRAGNPDRTFGAATSRRPPNGSTRSRAWPRTEPTGCGWSPASTATGTDSQGCRSCG
jgi:hypothetical protein